LRVWPIALVTGVLLIWGLWQAFGDWRQLNLVLVQGDRQTHNTKTNPRFWSDGWF
jgi:hypothetical protein